jgi:hypothetical protein
MVYTLNHFDANGFDITSCTAKKLRSIEIRNKYYNKNIIFLVLLSEECAPLDRDF